MFAPALMIFLSCFFSSSGSTGGGIKMVRAVVLFHQAVRELTRIVHPRAVVPVKFAGRVVENGVVLAVLAFMLMYGTTIIAATLALDPALIAPKSTLEGLAAEPAEAAAKMMPWQRELLGV